MSGPARGGQSGMTLVETLLAVMLSSLLILPVTGWATMALREQREVTTRSLSGTSLGMLRSVFTRDVTSSSDAWVDGKEQLSSCSDGSRDPIHLLALGHRDQRTTYTLIPDGDSYVLVRLRCASPGAEPTQRMELARGVIPAGTGATCNSGFDLADRANELGQKTLGTTSGCRRVTLQLTTTALDQVAMSATLRIGGTGTATLADVPEPVASADPTGGRRRLKVQFDARNSRDPNDEELRFTWDFGDGSTSEDPVPVHVFEKAGSYTVQLTATNATGLSSSTTLLIRVEDNPPTAVIAEPTDLSTFHRSQPIRFSSAGSNDDIDSDVGGSLRAFRWDFGDGSTSEEQNPVHSFDRLSPAGGYVVTLTVVDNAGLSASTQTRVMVVNRTPSVSIVASETSGTAPLLVDFHAVVIDETDMAGNPHLTYSWDLGDGRTSDAATPTDVVYESEGTFTVRLTVTDDVGETATATQDITVKTSEIPAPRGLRRVRAGAIAGGLRYIDTAWQPVAGAARYQVELTSETTDERVLVGSPNVTVRAGNLSKGSKYYRVRVRALTSDDEYGPWSATVRMRS